MTLTPSTSQLAFGLCTLTVFIVYWIYGQRQRNLPPGPRKYPLIGSALSKPTKLEWEAYRNWGKEYNSDIIHIDDFGTSIVILNSYKAATDLLDKRSGNFSSRPHMTMFHDLSGWGFIFVMLPYGDVWRSSRRMFTKFFSPTSNTVSEPQELIYVRRFLGQLLLKPSDFLQHVRTLVGSNVLSMAYSIKVRPYNDPFIKIVEEAVNSLAQVVVPGTFIVDSIPILKYLPEWFPGAKFQSMAATMRDQSAKMRNTTFAAAEELIASGSDYIPSLVSETLTEFQNSEAPSQDINRLKDIAAMAYIAGSDTTVSGISTFFLAMACYPEVQKEAQAELDNVLNGRLPEHADVFSLPYLSALVKEVFRWEPITPVGVPHLSTHDDIYNDYHIPANSTVVANQWGMLNDERDYPEPRLFNPKRFLKDGKLDSSVRDPMDIAFGFGRRACPGRRVAHSLLTITAASILSTFDVVRKVDENGREIVPKGEYSKSSALRQLRAFPCVIKPRSPHAVELIRSFVGPDGLEELVQ